MKKQELNDAGATLNNNVSPRVSPELNSLKQRAGKIKYGCLAWMIGLPLPTVIILMFYKGCDF